MRTVTFSDEKVAKEINEKFVAVWVRRGGHFHNCEAGTEQWIFQSSHEAYATKNIVSYFLTEDLKVLHYLTGYYAPDLYRDALGFVGSLYDRKGDMELFREVHKSCITVCTDETNKLLRAQKSGSVAKVMQKYDRFRYESADKNKITHTHSTRCVHSLAEALSYWGRVHQEFADRKELPELAPVMKNHLVGNPFSEEPPPELDPKPEPTPPTPPRKPAAASAPEPVRKPDGRPSEIQ